MRALQIVDRIADGREDEKSDDRAKRDLIGDAADLGVVVERNPRGGRPRRKVYRHLPLVGLATPPDWRRPPNRRGRAAPAMRLQLPVSGLGGAY